MQTQEPARFVHSVPVSNPFKTNKKKSRQSPLYFRNASAFARPLFAGAKLGYFLSISKVKLLGKCRIPVIVLNNNKTIVNHWLTLSGVKSYV
jgi:hypothetical protein